MKYEPKRRRYTLSTGREFNANLGLISVDDNGTLYEGYDASLDVNGHSDPQPDDPASQPWTREERIELADFMIERWQAFRAASCAAGGHDWSAWIRASSFTYPTTYARVRNYHVCGVSE